MHGPGTVGARDVSRRVTSDRGSGHRATAESMVSRATRALVLALDPGRAGLHRCRHPGGGRRGRWRRRNRRRSRSRTRACSIHAQGGEPDSLDPARAEPGGRGGQAIIQVYDTLVARPVEGPEFVPSLATEVPTQENGLVSEDGLTYTFPIREGRHVPRRHRADRRRREVLVGPRDRDGPRRRRRVTVHRHHRGHEGRRRLHVRGDAQGAGRVVPGGCRVHADGSHRQPGRGRGERWRRRR